MLIPSNPEEGQRAPLIFEYAAPPAGTNWADYFASRSDEILPVRTWTLHEVCTKLADAALAWHDVAESGGSKRTTLDELRTWIEDTRNLAERLPFGSLVLRARMHEVARLLEQNLDWPDEFFNQSPVSIEKATHAEFVVNIYLWSLHQLVVRVNELERAWGQVRADARSVANVQTVEIPITKFWPAMFAPPTGGDRDRPDPAFADYPTARKRVDRLDAKVAPALKDALMVSVLRQTLDPPNAVR